MRRHRLVFLAATLWSSAVAFAWAWPVVGRSLVATVQPDAGDRAATALARMRPELELRIRELGAAWGAPVLLRIFKQSSELELWVDAGDGFALGWTWPICSWSGTLGPKLAEGDGQAPEGYYHVRPSALNPRSRYHLSFDLGFPNAYDRVHGRTGSYLMVHGNCVSIGCYAMGDDAIEAIYTLVAAALAHGQREVPVHAYPFRFDDGWQQRHAQDAWLPFWRDLAEGDRIFRATNKPPRATVRDGRYMFQ